MAYPGPHARCELRGSRSICVSCADHLGLRLQLHQLRRAVPHGWRLYAIARRARPRRRRLPLLQAEDAGEHRSCPVHHLLSAGRRSAHLFRMALRRLFHPLQGSEHLQPGRHSDLSAEGPHSRDRCAPPAPGHRRDHPVHHLHSRGGWPQRLHDVEETESVVIRERLEQQEPTLQNPSKGG